jgi:hypothetical protein
MNCDVQYLAASKGEDDCRKEEEILLLLLLLLLLRGVSTTATHAFSQ